MKKIIIASFIILALSACSETDLLEKNPVAPGGETPDIPVETSVTEEGLTEFSIDTLFRNKVLDYKWVGTEGELNLAKYLVFSENGNVKMYTKPFENQDWELIQDFNIVKVKINSDDIDLMGMDLEDVERYDNTEGEISTIIDWEDLLNMELDQDGLEGNCMTLYPEGVPVGGNSPFSMDMCITGGISKMTIKMLNTTFNLQKQ